jgi:anaerobic magnesium-protoporphyrin IX monomethyl ester cyclase
VSDMKLLLIDPPYKALKGIGSECGYSMSTVSLAAFLNMNGIESGILTGNLLIDLPVHESLTFNVKKYAEGQKTYKEALENDNHYVWKKVAEEISTYNPKYIGLTCLTPMKDIVLKISKIIKTINKEIIVIIGGHHPTFCTDEMLNSPYIDYIVKGEGELPLLQLLKHLENKNGDFYNITGVAYKHNGGIISNDCFDMIDNLDSLPMPSRDSVINCDFDIYRAHFISTARGCPYTCSFCSDKKLWHSSVRRRSVNSCIKEIKYLIKKYNITYLDITDGTFTYDDKYVYEFCNNIINNDINIQWRCTARYDNVNSNMLGIMKKANCIGLYFGLESGSKSVLKSVKKQITVEKIIEATNMVSDSGINSVASVLFGLPDETYQDIENTLDLMKKLRVDLFDVNSYVPLPGTVLYEKMTDMEKKNINWKDTAFKSFDNCFNKHVSRDDLTKYITEAYSIAEARLLQMKKSGGWSKNTTKE